jgi:hypothetical protein
MKALLRFAGVLVALAFGVHGAYIEDDLKRNLFSDYNKHTAPRGAVVRHQLSVWQITAVSTEDQLM